MFDFFNLGTFDNKYMRNVENLLRNPSMAGKSGYFCIPETDRVRGNHPDPLPATTTK